MAQEGQERSREEATEQLKEKIEKNVTSSLEGLSKEETVNIWQVLHTSEVDAALEKIRHWAAESLAAAPNRVLP